MTAPDQRQVRQLAREHILDDARRAHDIGAAVLGHHGPDALTRHEYGAWCSAIREAIRTATVTVSWPGEQAQDVPTTMAAERIRALLKLAARVAELENELPPTCTDCHERNRDGSYDEHDNTWTCAPCHIAASRGETR